MMTIIAFVIGGLMGFVVGVLVYRNNAKRLESDLQTAQAEINKFKTLVPKK